MPKPSEMQLGTTVGAKITATEVEVGRVEEITVSDRGEDYTLRTIVDGHGYVHIFVASANGTQSPLPRMTPFEASMLAKLLNQSSEIADNK